LLRSALILILAIATISPAPQEPPLPARQEPPPSVIGARTFVSLDGRFSISLPERKGSSALAIPTPFGTAKGQVYQWQTKEATFGVGYADVNQSMDEPGNSKPFFTAEEETFKKLATANSGNVAPVKQITLHNHSGIEQRADLFTGTIIQRTYVASRRIYEIIAVLNNNQRGFESVAIGALDSFKILNDADVQKALSEEAAKAEPSPLPQTPVAERAGSDATDEGLHGRVKNVLTEVQEPGPDQPKRRETIDFYNEQGNLVRAESYDERNNLSAISVYGYIDGNRVYPVKDIDHDYDTDLVVTVPATGSKKFDRRYTQKFTYKYDDKKRLIEEAMFQNNGELWLRYIYKYKGNQKEEVSYSKDGSISQRSLYTLDDKGNPVKETIFSGDGSISGKQAYTYEFDAQGNWTKRTTSEMQNKDGREQPVLLFTQYRTITYY